ncbi:calpastatin [Pollutimonas subterranea]|uniref:Calpastatin n=1 Tax=Pollutimonas subterranea TaxID=2045210 RepID=A0A2N4U7X4_9BURK|nr:DUF1810 domain-containing protein [Pollutimonas subterranea]PLC51099.1 calpastatin [Pollutimonas subterranea]
MNDIFGLQRYVDAQDPVMNDVYDELRLGQKRSHWMWFIFPQMSGLGHSDMARIFAITSKEEGRAYLAHPLLGSRLRECTGLVNAVNGRTIEQIFGHIDAMKFRSSMTLFSSIAPAEPVFNDALKKYFDGKADAATLALLEPGEPS